MISYSVVFCAILAVVCCTDLTFPAGFKFGAATSSYQIEGGWNASDKSENIWDVLTHTDPAAIHDHANGDIACDSYNLWQRDIDIAAELGLDFYRFSLSWTRLLPSGFPDKISEDGVKYYNNLINGLLDKGIEPMITIFHWDLPQSLQDLGGWTNPMIADWFADYARVVYNLFGDRVKTWITINEPKLICDGGYGMGILAPRVRSPEFGNYICAKNVLVAHAKAWRIYDQEFKPKYKGKLGISNHLLWLEAATEGDEEIAELARQLSVGLYSHAIYAKQGGWPPTLQEAIGNYSKKQGYFRSRMPAFTKDEIELIRGTSDFYAFNHYTSRTVTNLKEGETVLWPASGSQSLGIKLGIRPEWKPTITEWFFENPEGIRHQLNWLKKQYGDITFIITENGFPTESYELEDKERIDYIYSNLKQILLAIKEDGVNVIGYTAWSLIDNFEWTAGYICVKSINPYLASVVDYGLTLLIMRGDTNPAMGHTRFGLYEVDFNSPSRTRTPRASAQYYASVIQRHSLNVTNKYINDEL